LAEERKGIFGFPEKRHSGGVMTRKKELAESALHIEEGSVGEP